MQRQKHMRLIFYVFGIILSATISFADPRFWQYEFPETNFQKTSLESWLEIRSGGVGKDGIPALDHVGMIAVAAANIPAAEPVITLELAGQAPRAYPLRYMTAARVHFCSTVNFRPTASNHWHVWCAWEIAPGHSADFQVMSERSKRLVSP
jgi:hypothetical protein